MSSSIKKRKKEKAEGKIALIVMLCLILAGLYYFDYDFSNNLYNGLITLVLSISTATILSINKYYIETGKHPSTKTDVEEFKLFTQMHPFITLYNKIIIIIFVIMVLISVAMMISSFF